MMEQTLEQHELEEQAIALKWQSDVKWLRKTLKFMEWGALSELREAQYFAEAYIPEAEWGQSLRDVINVSFIQDLPYSKWQTGAIQNAKKILSSSHKTMLSHWAKDRRRLFDKKAHFPKENMLSALTVVRIFALLNRKKENNPAASDIVRMGALRTQKSLMNLVDILPFFDEPATWSDHAKQRFQDVLALNLCRVLAEKPEERDSFMSQQLTLAALREPNNKRSIFKIELLGKVQDLLGADLDKKKLMLMVKNLENSNQIQRAEQVRKSFHMGSKSFSRLKMFVQRAFSKR